MGGVLLRSLSNKFSFSKSTLGSIGVGGDLDLSKRPAVGPDSISSTLLSDRNQVPSPQRPSCGRVVYSEQPRSQRP